MTRPTPPAPVPGLRTGTARAAFLVLLPALAGCAGETAPPSQAPGATPSAAADAELARTIESYVEPALADHDFSGVILVGTRSGARFERAYGQADDAAGTPNGLDTRFAIASLTKTFTAGAALIARDRGLLALDDTLDRFGLEFPRAAEITVRHLLTHSSGLANPDYVESLDGRIDHRELVARIVAQPLLFEPGSQNRYSNAGFNVLAWVVGRASGTSYDAFLREQILEPLGLRATGHVAGPAPDVATGYTPAPPPAWRRPTPLIDPSYMTGSGSLVSTARDLRRWAHAVGDQRLFAWRELEWPYGWGRVTIGTHEGIEQTGATPGFTSSLLVFPDEGLYVVVLTNQEFGGWVPFGRALAAIAFGEPHEAWPRRATVELSPDELRRCAGRYRDGEQAVAAVVEDGHLWLYNDGWPLGKYLAPLGPTTFAVPSDIGTIAFAGEATAGFAELTWTFGDSGRTYRRER